MTRYLLDPNIISNVTRPAPSESLLTWMAQQADEDLFIASLTVAEIRRGVLEKPAESVISSKPGFRARKGRRRSSPDACWRSMRRRGWFGLV